MSEFLREIRAEGWSATMRPGGHYQATHPRAIAPVLFAATPSDCRWLENTRAWMRRVMPAEPKRAPAAEPRPKRKPRSAPRPAPVRSYPEGQIPMHPLPQPERRLYPPLEPPRRRLAGGPVGYRSCLDRV